MTNFLIFFTIFVNVTFAGHMTDSAVDLGAIGLTNTLLSCMVITLFIGINSAQETLTS